MCNTHAVRSCEAIAALVMFEADLWNVAILSGNFFRFGRCGNFGVQRDGFLAPLPLGKASFSTQKHSKVLTSSARGPINVYWQENIDRKGTSTGWISYILRFAQPPNSTSSLAYRIGPPFTMSYERRTDRLTDRRVRHNKGVWNFQETTSPFGYKNCLTTKKKQPVTFPKSKRFMYESKSCEVGMNICLT